MNKRILLINPPQNAHHKGTTSRYPSGALLLIGTMCQEGGHSVKIYDGSVDNTDLKHIVCEYKPDIVGITVNTFQTKYASQYLKIIKDINDNILTVIGGPHVSGIGLESLTYFEYSDIAVIGEGELTFLDIAEEKDFFNIPGICYRGKITEPRLPLKSLDYIPLTNLDLVDITKYESKGKSMFIMASRGCPYGCIYCNKSIFGTRVRFRKPETILEEIKWLYNQYGITEIYFQDDTFNLRREWIDKILTLIIENGLNKNILYQAPFRANEKLVDEKLLSLAKEANFKTILYGVENGNQDMLNRMHKGLTISEIKRAFKLTHDAGLNTIGAFMIGLPGETVETIKDSINLWKEIRPTYLGIAPAIPFPNTQFENEVRESGHLVNSNYNDYRCGGSYIRTAKLTKNELYFYSSVAQVGQRHAWVYKFPIFTIGENWLLCGISLCLIRGARLYKQFSRYLSYAFAFLIRCRRRPHPLN